MFIRHIIQHQSQCYYLSHIVQIELAQALLLRLTRWKNLPTLKCRSHIYSQRQTYSDIINDLSPSSNPFSRMNVSDNHLINKRAAISSQACARLIFLPPRQYQLFNMINLLPRKYQLSMSQSQSPPGRTFQTCQFFSE